jgi:cell division protein FtsQ
MRSLSRFRRKSPEPGRGAARPRARASARRGRRFWTTRAIVAGLGAALLLAAGSGAYWLWESGRVAREAAKLEARVLAMTARAGLKVGSVLVEGRRETPRKEILSALAVRTGAPILAFDPRAAKSRLERIGWVRQAVVERRLPGTIVVRLVERRPFALWQREGKMFLVDDTGSVILRGGLERFARLPLVVGEDAAENAPALFTMLALAPELASRVTAAIRVGARRWNLRLDNGIDVRLPEEAAAEAWQRLAEIERVHGLLERDILAVDLRIAGRLILQMPPEAAKRAREPGADT